METFKFSIQSLLSKKDGRVSGPMSPLLFALGMGNASDCRVDRLARVRFEDETINQNREGGGFTGHDTLIICGMYANDIWLTLWVDTGTGGLAVAVAMQSGRQVIVTPAYRAEAYARNLNFVEITEIFDLIFSNMELIAVKEVQGTANDNNTINNSDNQ